MSGRRAEAGRLLLASALISLFAFRSRGAVWGRFLSESTSDPVFPKLILLATTSLLSCGVDDIASATACVPLLLLIPIFTFLSRMTTRELNQVRLPYMEGALTVRDGSLACALFKGK